MFVISLIGSYKVYKFAERKGTYHETICQNIKKLTSPSKIIRYKNMNNFFHHSMKNFQMEGIFGPYLPKLGQIIEDKRIARSSIKEYSQNCILQLLTRKVLILKNRPFFLAIP